MLGRRGILINESKIRLYPNKYFGGLIMENEIIDDEDSEESSEEIEDD